MNIMEINSEFRFDFCSPNNFREDNFWAQHNGQQMVNVCVLVYCKLCMLSFVLLMGKKIIY